MSSPAHPRVLLLDDDPTMRLFVGLALDELGVAVIACEAVDQALSELQSAPCALLLTDLVLRTGSGFDLLEALQQTPALRGDGRVVVFSADIDAAVNKRIESLGVWRTLRKPASLVELQACTREALESWGAVPASADADRPCAARSRSLSEHEHEAMQRHFQGNQGLFVAFRDACHNRFPEDIVEADAALARLDAAGLKRLSHSLKTVLAMLGHTALASKAAALDAAAGEADWPRIQTLWAALRDGLQAAGNGQTPRALGR